MDSQLRAITQKVDQAQRLSAEDGLYLMKCHDIWAVGQLADKVRQRLHGNVAYYNINRHLNYTNYCALSCKFCAFHRKAGQDGGYEYSVEQVVEQAKGAQDAGATEIHIVGGLHPTLPFAYYIDMLKAIRQHAPLLHIKAFTAVEVVHLARISKRGRDIPAVLAELKEAGLGSLPGGGAEIFDDRVHDEAFKGKIRSDTWFRVHREAHKVGLMSNATILFGHIESIEDRIQHFCMLREAQDEVIRENLPGRFQTVIPLPFIPDASELEHLPGPSGLDCLRMLAVSRLMLDNFLHVKSFWIMQTLELTQLALSNGVDDMDGTVVWYDITKMSGSDTHQEVTVADMEHVARQAGYDPVERDTLYRRVVRDGAQWSAEPDATALVTA